MAKTFSSYMKKQNKTLVVGAVILLLQQMKGLHLTEREYFLNISKIEKISMHNKVKKKLKHLENFLLSMKIPYLG
jgi:hypothetical protein